MSFGQPTPFAYFNAVAYFLPFFALDRNSEIGGTIARHRDDMFGANRFCDLFVRHVISSGCDWDSYQKIKVSMVSLFWGFNGDADMGVELL
jgi:hypothetical protein